MWNIKLILIGMLAVSSTFVVFSQNSTNVQINQNTNVYIIDGVSSIEDVGGVECNALAPQFNDTSYKLKFTNYNNFNVSVLYKVEVLDYKCTSYKTGTITLNKGESKTIALMKSPLGDIRIISREIGKTLSPVVNNSEELVMVAGYLIRHPQIFKISGHANVTEFINNMNRAKVYGKANWRLPTNDELRLLSIDNSNSKYYSKDNWNRYNINSAELIIVCDNF